MIRDDIKAATITAMKAKEKERTATLRQISAKIKDRDIAERTSGKEIPDDELVTSVLQKMAKQRRESITMYVDGGREELADKERSELAIIEGFLPQMMSEEETKAAIEAAKVTVGAASIKDMGKVMAELKSKYGAVVDMGTASAILKKSF
ncbi:GatB/YqeY domain-containing protein [Erythrobacter crassostreae]|uniref:GatB/YqeY domain-containing protein n=1 Tax=Erythrobacter crassostreae TaxID=2828328 RepID=A0A9X1F6W5_9SPHN|nr:GatB/YqeY domain-containing protein [Erythrobacter crassostrea]MBV7259910.1 GatB/YqeY domain-containing protein [Erythrobacter crassostrea]